ncbi:Uncharacterised protein [Mycobacteroides abscessus subsp. abscessus]|nr:Uncharacterised protein [Mycobacteroides abscessus subsp. abscessus]
MQVPGTMHLGSPVTPIDQLIGDVRQRGIVNQRRGVQHTTHRLAGLRGGRDQTLCCVRLGDVSQRHVDLGAALPDLFNRCQCLRLRSTTAVEDDSPDPGRCQFARQKQSQPAEAAGDNVGTVPAESRGMRRRNHRGHLTGLGQIQDELAGMSCRSHHPDRLRGLLQRRRRDLRQGQHPLGHLPVQGSQCAVDRFRPRLGHQDKIDGVERQIPPEGEQAQPGVAVDVALADLNEAATEGQQFHSGPLCGAGERVEHDVHTVAIGVATDQLGEVRAARVVHMLYAPAAQQVSPLRAARGGVNLRAGRTCDGNRCLSHTTGPGMDQHLVARRDPRELV